MLVGRTRGRKDIVVLNCLVVVDFKAVQILHAELSGLTFSAGGIDEILVLNIM